MEFEDITYILQQRLSMNCFLFEGCQLQTETQKFKCLAQDKMRQGITRVWTW